MQKGERGEGEFPTENGSVSETTGASTVFQRSWYRDFSDMKEGPFSSAGWGGPFSQVKEIGTDRAQALLRLVANRDDFPDSRKT
jgi:hypothetical protein